MNTNEHEIGKLIQQGESLSLEFKSDLKCLPDRELVAAVVSLANTEGGDLLLGVEDDGMVTGLHANHLNVSGIPSLIANKTNPAVSVRVERYDLQGKGIARISVPKSRQLVSTSDGLLVRRRLKLDGTPEAVPFYPHEFINANLQWGLLIPQSWCLRRWKQANSIRCNACAFVTPSRNMAANSLYWRWRMRNSMALWGFVAK